MNPTVLNRRNAHLEIPIHYTKGSEGLEIVAVCQICLEKYLEKTKVDTDKKDEDTERMKRKW